MPEPSDRSMDADGAAPVESLYGTELGEGALVGRFVVERLCSRGGFGIVYRARRIDDHRSVALKVLRSRLAGSERLLRRFEQEAEAIGSIRHPGIVELLDHGFSTEGLPFIAMEWLDGETLDHVLRSGSPLPTERALRICERLASALGAVHAAGIVHRDLKGSNVMLLPARDGDDAIIKLLDFGIAKLLHSSEKLTATDARVGTPSYMAPEQILGLPVHPTTDVYALGVLAFQMFTGRLPFHAESAVEVEKMHLQTSPPRACDFAAVPGGVADVLVHALAKRPEDRPATVEQLAADLRRAAGEPATSGPFRVREPVAVGVWIAKRAPAGALDEARQACVDGGLQLVDLGSDGVLAVAELPVDDVAGAELRASVLRLALAAASDEARGLRATVHVAPAVRLLVRGIAQYVGGALLDIDDWAAADGALVQATPAALDTIEQRFVVGPGAPSAPRPVVGARDSVEEGVGDTRR